MGVLWPEGVGGVLVGFGGVGARGVSWTYTKATAFIILPTVCLIRGHTKLKIKKKEENTQLTNAKHINKN